MDEDMIGRIDELVEEEHRLHARHAQGEPLTDKDRQRLSEVEVQLDQCWDLLRQRRARATPARTREDVAVRPSDIVEHYQQ